MTRAGAIGLLMMGAAAVAAPRAYGQQTSSPPAAAAQPPLDLGPTVPTTTAPLAEGAAKAKPPGDDPTRLPATGPLSGIGKILADDGVKFRAMYYLEPADALSGGVHDKYDTVGQLYFGADLDLQKILGITGGSFHFTFYRDTGNSLNKNNTGTFVKEQEIYKNDFPQLHLGLVSYEQRLFDNRLDIIIGRLGSTAYFGHVAPGCYFQSGSTCGIPSILNSETGFTLLPSATWGGNVKYKFTQHTYVDFGSFEINPFIAHTAGFTWGTHYATGDSSAIEFGYDNSDIRKTAYPTELKAGYYAATAPRNNPFYNTLDQSIALHGGKALVADSLRQGAWLVGSRTIWRPDLTSTHNLTAFGGYVQPFEKEEVMDAQIFGGLLLRGTFAGRPDDTIGFETTWFHLSPLEREYLRDARIKDGGPDENNKSNQFVMELDYGIQLHRAIRLTPNFQYIINPDNSNLPKINFVPKNLSVIGIKLVIDLADLVGLPHSALGD